MKYFHTFILVCLTSCISLAQDIIGQTMYFNFDQNNYIDNSGNNNGIFITARDSTPNCGVNGGMAMKFDGINTSAIISGPAAEEQFRTGDFSLSFYMKVPGQGGGIMDIVSKRKRGCTIDSSFSIRYAPYSNTLYVVLSERFGKIDSISQRLDYGRCWQHICITRNYSRLYLYVNGRLANQANSTSRVAINNDQALALSQGSCIGISDRKFAGFIDEFRVYNRAITLDEVQSLYARPDKITSRDTIMFLGDSIRIKISQTCTNSYIWSSNAGTGQGISDLNVSTPLIKPTVAGDFTYKVAMKEGLTCTAIDSIHIKIIDPGTLDCGKLLLPTAFTPNDDGINDYLFISNPYAIEELQVFEIFDIWGSRVFMTQDKREKWDGTFKGQKLNPGVFLWKAKFTCKGRPLSEFGSVAIMK
jgi:gliding motility-associated-like protein